MKPFGEFTNPFGKSIINVHIAGKNPRVLYIEKCGSRPGYRLRDDRRVADLDWTEEEIYAVYNQREPQTYLFFKDGTGFYFNDFGQQSPLIWE